MNLQRFVVVVARPRQEIAVLHVCAQVAPLHGRRADVQRLQKCSLSRNTLLGDGPFVALPAATFLLAEVRHAFVERVNVEVHPVQRDVGRVGYVRTVVAVIRGELHPDDGARRGAVVVVAVSPGVCGRRNWAYVFGVRVAAMTAGRVELTLSRVMAAAPGRVELS